MGSALLKKQMELIYASYHQGVFKEGSTTWFFRMQPRLWTKVIRFQVVLDAGDTFANTSHLFPILFLFFFFLKILRYATCGSNVRTRRVCGCVD